MSLFLVDWLSEIKSFFEKLLFTLLFTLLLEFLYNLIHERRILERRKRALKVLRVFYSKGRVTQKCVILPEATAINRGILVFEKTLGSHDATSSEVKWLSLSGLESSGEILLRDLCREPPIIIKRGGSYPRLIVAMPAARITRGAFRDIIVSCFNTEDIYVDKWLEAVYSEGFTRFNLRIGVGEVAIKLEWYHYAVEDAELLTMQRSQVRVKAEMCSAVEGRSPLRFCTSLLEVGKPGVIEYEFKYPTTRRIFIGHISGAGFEGVEDIVKEFPRVFAVKGVTIKLRVKRSSKTVAEESSLLT